LLLRVFRVVDLKYGRDGYFGKFTCGSAYLPDLLGLEFDKNGYWECGAKENYRNGICILPMPGPVCQALNENRGDRMAPFHQLQATIQYGKKAEETKINPFQALCRKKYRANERTNIRTAKGKTITFSRCFIEDPIPDSPDNGTHATAARTRAAKYRRAR